MVKEYVCIAKCFLTRLISVAHIQSLFSATIKGSIDGDVQLQVNDFIRFPER